MAVNLVELVKGYLTPDIIQKGASFVGESSQQQKAMNAIVPTLSGARYQTSTNGALKAQSILDTASTTAAQSTISESVLRRRDDTKSDHPR